MQKLYPEHVVVLQASFTWCRPCKGFIRAYEVRPCQDLYPSAALEGLIPLANSLTLQFIPQMVFWWKVHAAEPSNTTKFLAMSHARCVLITPESDSLAVRRA